MKTPARSGSTRLDEVYRLLSEEVAERHLAEESFRTMVEESPNGIIMVDAEGKIVLVNKTAERLFGYQRDEIVGQKVEVLVPEALRSVHPRFRTSYQHRPEARPMGHGRDLTALRKDGTTFPVEIGLNPVETNAGKRILATVIDITARKRAEQHRDMLLRELSHRVKNNLAVISSIARLTRATSSSPDEFFEAFEGRLAALAAVHGLLSETEWQGADLAALVASVLAPFTTTAINVTCQGPPVLVSPDMASPISLILHELATNAAKYGALSQPSGQLDIAWRTIQQDGAGEMLELTWMEQDGPPVNPPKHEGFGTRVMRQLTERQLGGTIETEFAPSGLRSRLAVPYKRPAAAGVTGGQAS
jgi:PAS domain S-box-containing protein